MDSLGSRSGYEAVAYPGKPDNPGPEMDCLGSPGKPDILGHSSPGHIGDTDSLGKPVLPGRVC